MVFWELYVADASCWEFESTDCWAVVDVVWVHRQEVLEGVPLNASRLLTAVRHHVARLMRLVTQVYGHSLREVLGLNDDLPLARGVSGIPGTDEPKLRVANLLLLERVGLPTPRTRLGTIRRF